MSEVAIEVRATTAGLARVTQALAGQPLRPGYVTRVGRMLIHARSGRCLLVMAQQHDLEAVLTTVTAATGAGPWVVIRQLGDARVLREYLSTLPTPGAPQLPSALAG